MFKNQKIEETRERILAAAKQQFLKNGYDKTRLEDIVREACVSKTAIYKIFGGKRELFLAFNQSMALQILTAITQTKTMDASTIEHVQDNLLKIGNDYLNNILSKERLELLRLNISIASRFKDASIDFYLSGPDVFINILTKYFDEINQNNILTIPNTKFAAEQFASMMRGANHLRALLDVDYECSQESINTYVEHSVNLFINGFKQGQ